MKRFQVDRYSRMGADYFLLDSMSYEVDSFKTMVGFIDVHYGPGVIFDRSDDLNNNARFHITGDFARRNNVYEVRLEQ